MRMLLWKTRSEKGITLVELAEQTGISKSALSNYENNKRYPNMAQMELLAKALDTSITDLFDSPYK